MKLFSGWLTIVQTLLTFIVCQSFFSAVKIFYELNPEATPYFYPIVAINSIGYIFFLILLFICVVIIKVPIPHQNVPWAMTKSKGLLLKEALKVLLVA